MTDSTNTGRVTTGSAPAGWYADPSGGSPLRWWDGRAWTGYVNTPAAPAAVGATPAPADFSAWSATTDRHGVAHAGPGTVPTSTSTWMIWAVVLLPLLSILILQITPVPDPALLAAGIPDTRATILSLLVSLLGLVFYGVTVLFSYLDWAALGRRGVARRMHWAWSFLWGFVYVVGRGVVLGRLTGRRQTPTWVAIAVQAVVFIAAIVWIAVVLTAYLDAVLGMSGIYGVPGAGQDRLSA